MKINLIHNHRISIQVKDPKILSQVIKEITIINQQKMKFNKKEHYCGQRIPK